MKRRTQKQQPLKDIGNCKMCLAPLAEGHWHADKNLSVVCDACHEYLIQHRPN